MPRHTRKGSKSRKIHKRKTQKRTIRKNKKSKMSQKRKRKSKSRSKSKSKSRSKSKSKSKMLKGGVIGDEVALVHNLKNMLKKSNNIAKRHDIFKKLLDKHNASCFSQELRDVKNKDKCKKITENMQVSKNNVSKTFVGLIVSLLLNKAKEIAKLYRKKRDSSGVPQFIVDLKLYTSYFIEKDPYSINLKYNNLIGGIGLNRDRFKEETSKTVFDYFENDINNKKSTSDICRNDSICITNIDKIKKMNETLYKNMKPEIYFSYAVELTGILKEFLNRK